MPVEQVEALADAGQHAERQDVDLDHPQRVEVVLVPLDDRAVGHGGVLDRHHLIQPSAGDDEAADMLRDRKSVVWGKSVSVRVDLGGRRIITKKTTINQLTL